MKVCKHAFNNSIVIRAELAFGAMASAAINASLDGVAMVLDMQHLPTAMRVRVLMVKLYQAWRSKPCLRADPLRAAQVRDQLLS